MIRINPSKVSLKGEDLSEYENIKANHWGKNETSVNSNKNTKDNINIQKNRKDVINERIGLDNNNNNKRK